MVQSVAQTLFAAGSYTPIRFLAVLNKVLCVNIARIKTDRTLTLCFADFTPGYVTLSGQHEEVIVLRGNGTLERIDTTNLGFPVGLEADIMPFLDTALVRFEPGDTLVMYTDGITEAESDAGHELFGIDRLCESIRARHGQTATEMKEGIIADLFGFIGTQRVHDDITLLVVRHR
jgi:sigma-B regulation protein RsbU (phosphoserine phosphatase)